MVILVPTWASPEGGDWVPQGHHLDLVTQVLIWAAFTWILSSTSGPHLDLVTLVPHGPHPDVVTLVPTWLSPEPDDSGPPRGLTLTW